MADPKGKLDPRRDENVGSSECAPLFSLDWDPSEELRPFKTRLQLWLEKAGKVAEIGPDPSERIFWGTYQEPQIAKALRELTGGWSVSKARFRIHPSVDGMSASPDFEVLARDLPGGGAICEAKTVDLFEYRRWTEVVEPDVVQMRKRSDGSFVPDEWVPAERQPPFRIKLQVQHQLACYPGPEVGLIAALVGGNRLELFRIPRHEGMIARIEKEVAEFWRSIREDDPPDPDWMLDSETLCALFSDADEGTAIDLRDSEDAGLAVKEYASWRELKKEADKEMKARKARILALMGRAHRGLLPDGYRVAAGVVDGGEISYYREPYRGFNVSKPKGRKGRR